MSPKVADLKYIFLLSHTCESSADAFAFFAKILLVQQGTTEFIDLVEVRKPIRSDNSISPPESSPQYYPSLLFHLSDHLPIKPPSLFMSDNSINLAGPGLTF